MTSRWDPFSELYRLQNQMLARYGDAERRAFTPAVDIFETQEAIVVKAELPGLKAEDVSIDMHDRRLTLSGESKFEGGGGDDGYQRIERSYGSFSRSFALPETVDLEHVDAEMKDGVLTVRLPKRAETQPRKIAVRSASGQPNERAAKPSGEKKPQPALSHA